jgi:hypothetical protein
MSRGSREEVAALAGRLEVQLGTDAGALRTWVSDLFDVHFRQWDLESACRSPRIGAAELGVVKREIDESNARRIHCVRQLDAIVASAVVVTDPRADSVHWPMTVGQAMDQLTISVVRCVRMGSGSPASDRLFFHQIRSASDMVELLVGGQLVLPPGSAAKHYGVPFDDGFGGVDVDPGDDGVT